MTQVLRHKVRKKSQINYRNVSKILYGVGILHFYKANQLFNFSWAKIAHSQKRLSFMGSVSRNVMNGVFISQIPIGHFAMSNVNLVILSKVKAIFGSWLKNNERCRRFESERSELKNFWSWACKKQNKDVKSHPNCAKAGKNSHFRLSAEILVMGVFSVIEKPKKSRKSLGTKIFHCAPFLVPS